MSSRRLSSNKRRPGTTGCSRRSPIRWRTSSVPRHGLRGVGSLKQLPKPVCQQFDGLPQGAEWPNPDYRDGSVQVKRWGTQYFHGIDRMIPGNKASGQQPDTIIGLNERQLHMYVVDFSRNHCGEAGTLHPIDEARPRKHPGGLSTQGARPKLFQSPSTLLRRRERSPCGR